jgi:hypothetical protein
VDSKSQGCPDVFTETFDQINQSNLEFYTSQIAKKKLLLVIKVDKSKQFKSFSLPKVPRR